MTSKEIFLVLKRILGPLKLVTQPEDSVFIKFQDLLQQALSQPLLDVRRSGLFFPDFHPHELPDSVTTELEKMTAAIIKAQAIRKPADPVFWLRQRSVNMVAGFEETLENFVVPSFSFGPFTNEQGQLIYFDFFTFLNHLRFEITQGGIPDFIIITLPPGVPLPPAGRQSNLSFDDCTLWLSVKTIAPNGDKKYVGFRAKNLVLKPTGIIALQATGFASIFSQNFEISFDTFDALTKEDAAERKANYPAKVVLSFKGTKPSLQVFDHAAITANGDNIALTITPNILPRYLEAEALVQFPLNAGKDSFEILSNNTARFQLAGKALITEGGWYLPVVSIDNAVSIGNLGMQYFSGYLGIRLNNGLTIDWPRLDDGLLPINKCLVLARPGRVRLQYSFSTRLRSKQQIDTWKAANGDRNVIKLQPPPVGEGICLDDSQGMEMLLQATKVSMTADRPLNTDEKRFSITGHLGAIIFLKINADTTLYLIASQPPVAGENRKRRIPQSLCLSNALLTTDNPISVFASGLLLTNDLMSEGLLHLVFPVYRLINTLPDPYISNQDGIFDLAELARFNELWRNGMDTLNDRFQFSVTSVIQWNETETALQFLINQSSLFGRITNDEMISTLRQSPPPCDVQNDIGFHNAEIENLVQVDFDNAAGAFGFLQSLPGDRSLVDVSGRANFWGVSFSNRVPDEKKVLSESLGFPASFPYRIKNMDLVSSGRMSRLFTLPHIQWEPVVKLNNPFVAELDIPDLINFTDNGAPTRIASANKTTVQLAPKNLYQFIVEGFNQAENPQAAAAHFTLPFGICAFAYFNPKKIKDLPGAAATANEPIFSNTKTGDLAGAMQLRFEALPPPNVTISEKDNSKTYFIGSVTQLADARGQTFDVLGKIVGPQFRSEFSLGNTAKVPLERIDFSGYGASIFSKWVHESANFGQVSQVRFDVMIGRTAHEVVQIKTLLFPCAAPLVRSVIIERNNTGIITRYDSGWVATGPGEFNFLSHPVSNPLLETNPYNFHPGAVKGFYNLTEIKDIPREMDIVMTDGLGKTIRFTGVYYNTDIEMENIEKGGLPANGSKGTRVHSAGQFGYVMLADPSNIKENTTLATLFPPKLFKDLLNHKNVGGNLGGPINAVMNIAACDQRMLTTRVDVSATNEAIPGFVVAVRGTIGFVKEGSWSVVKCLANKDVVPLAGGEAVPLIRHGILKIDPRNNVGKVSFNRSRHSLGDPAEIDKYAPGATSPVLQYSFLQTTGTQKLLFRRPSFSTSEPHKIKTETPDLADAFRLLKSTTIFPNLANTLSLPDGVKQLLLTGDGTGLKFDDALFKAPVNLDNFIPQQLTKDATAREFTLIKESGFEVFIRYGTSGKPASAFQIDLNSEALDDAVDKARKKWQTVNKDVVVVVNLGPLKPLLELTGQFRSEAGKDPVFENPKAELGPELQAVKDILQVLATLAGKGKEVADSLKVVMGNSPDSWNYKMSIDQRIPVIQFPDTAKITLTTPPPLIIEASLSLGVFFNLSLSPDPKNLIKPGAGATFGFEGMIQIQLITIGIAAAYGVGITKVKAYVDFTDPKPVFDFTFGFGATVIVDLPVVGLASITRSFSLGGNIDSGKFKAVAGQMLRGVLSLAGGLLMVTIQIEGSAGVERKQPNDPKTTALFEMIFSLDVSLAFVISYDFSKRYTEEIALN